MLVQDESVVVDVQADVELSYTSTRVVTGQLAAVYEWIQVIAEIGRIIPTYAYY